jgi:hypothetical protein
MELQNAESLKRWIFKAVVLGTFACCNFGGIEANLAHGAEKFSG